MQEFKHLPTPKPSSSIDIWSRTIVALVIGILLGAVISLTGLSALAEYLMPLIIGFVIFVIFMAGLAFLLVQNKEKVLHKIFGVRDTDLSDAKENAQFFFINAWNKEFTAAKENFNALFTKVLAWYSWMSFRRWILSVFQILFVSFGGMLGTMLLYNQNKLLSQQNILLQNQNYRLDQQTYLQEADRRSSLIFLMGNLLDAMDRELKTDVGQPGIRDVSPQIIGRVVALSKGLKPYRYLANDSLVSTELSPERGQLLISLLNSELDNGSLRRIFQFADFTYSDLKGAVLSGEFLGGIHLQNADLSGATLDETDLSRADLSGANLKGAILAHAKLQEARFRGAQMEDAYLESTDLSRANLYGAKLNRANLAGANLKQAHFTGADLSNANISAAEIAGAGLDQTTLDSLNIGEREWMSAISSPDSIRGLQYLQLHYRLDSVQQGSHWKYVLLKKKG